MNAHRRHVRRQRRLHKLPTKRQKKNRKTIARLCAILEKLPDLQSLVQLEAALRQED